eukprot:3418984-Pyramimonas_sp.AAC.1
MQIAIPKRARSASARRTEQGRSRQRRSYCWRWRPTRPAGRASKPPRSRRCGWLCPRTPAPP